MRIVYVLLSPTFGMHQYTADFANRLAVVGHEVHLVTTKNYRRERYSEQIIVHTPTEQHNTGLSRAGLKFAELSAVEAAVKQIDPAVIHFTGPHIWNLRLVERFKQAGYPVLHTIHDLDPHHGRQFGWLLHFWNRYILHHADHILVHGEQYVDRIVELGVAPEKITHTPLLHLFLSHDNVITLTDLEHGVGSDSFKITYEPFALFFGRMERYKGVEHLLSAFAQMKPQSNHCLVLAGQGNVSEAWLGNLPPNVDLRNRLIDDDEAIDLFRRCSLVVLPYLDATQSALIAAAYFFHKPVLVTRTGALNEYVEQGLTGIIVESGHPHALARVLTDLLSSPTRVQEMGDAGRRWYEVIRQQELAQLETLYANLAQKDVMPR